MPLFIKTELFKSTALGLLPNQRKKIISAHIEWVKNLSDSGIRIASGYLVDANKQAGGGGWLIMKAESFEKAKLLIEQDPMIKRDLVDWKLQEWIPIHGELFT